MILKDGGGFSHLEEKALLMERNQRLRVAPCPECGTRSIWVLLKLEVRDCRGARSRSLAFSLRFWGTSLSGFGSTGRLVWGNYNTSLSLLPLKRSPIRKYIFLFTGSCFPTVCPCLPGVGVLSVEQRLMAPALMKETADLLWFRYFYRITLVVHRFAETLSTFVFPEKQNVGSFIFLQGVVPNVMDRSDSEFSGVFLFYFLLTDDLLLNN